MADEKDLHSTLIAILERGATQPNNIGRNSFLEKNGNILVMGTLAAVGALVWTVVIDTPTGMGVLQQQTSEIRATVLETRASVADLNKKIDETVAKTADQQARLSAVEATVGATSEGLTKLDERTTELERGRR